MIELNIIKYLLKKNTYNKYRAFIKAPKEYTSLYESLDTLHLELGRDLSLEEFGVHALHINDSVTDLLDMLDSCDMKDDFVENMVKELSHRAWAHEHALLAIKVSEGNAHYQEVLDHAELIDMIYDPTKEADEFVSDDIGQLLRETARQSGLNWRLPQLQEALGGLVKGDFGFVFARPETGKTTFLASEVTFMASQVNRPILWFNNEERGQKVVVRLAQAAMGYTNEEMEEHRDTITEEYYDHTHGMLKFKDVPVLHRKEVENLCKRYNPSLILIDQIDKVKGFKADRPDRMYGDIYVWARELAKTYCPVVGVCQASVSAENKKFLTMEDIAEAKTSKAAEGDFIIGIGKTHNIGYENIRHIHLVKNKLTGDHAKIDCRILTDVARYGEL